MGVSSLPKAVTWRRTGRDSNPRPFWSQAKMEFHDADTDTDMDILATILARMSVLVSVSVSASWNANWLNVTRLPNDYWAHSTGP